MGRIRGGKDIKEVVWDDKIGKMCVWDGIIRDIIRDAPFAAVDGNVYTFESCLYSVL